MSMRVIGGIYRHRKLVYPENDKNIRPTKDRIREALFSILGDLSDKTFLDLYAGSGSIGIEAISRGASLSVFVDHSESALKYVRENIRSLQLNDYSEVILSTDFGALKLLNDKGYQFDVIYLDPPYELGQYEDILSFIYNTNLLKENGLIVSESNRTIEINPLCYQKVKEYHYGEILLTTIKGEKNESCGLSRKF